MVNIITKELHFDEEYKKRKEKERLKNFNLFKKRQKDITSIEEDIEIKNKDAFDRSIIRRIRAR